MESGLESGLRRVSLCFAAGGKSSLLLAPFSAGVTPAGHFSSSASRGILASKVTLAVETSGPGFCFSRLSEVPFWLVPFSQGDVIAIKLDRMFGTSTTSGASGLSLTRGNFCFLTAGLAEILFSWSSWLLASWAVSAFTSSALLEVAALPARAFFVLAALARAGELWPGERLLLLFPVCSWPAPTTLFLSDLVWLRPRPRSSLFTFPPPPPPPAPAPAPPRPRPRLNMAPRP